MEIPESVAVGREAAASVTAATAASASAVRVLMRSAAALVANVAGKSLVVLTACGHSGVVNTIRYARRLTGEGRVQPIVGGFHLSGPLLRGSSPDLRRARRARRRRVRRRAAGRSLRRVR